MRPLIRIVFVWPLATIASSAGAHAVDAVDRAMPEWSFEPWITVPLVIALASFAIGWSRLSRRSTLGVAGLRRRALAFGCGWLVLAVALISPLHALGEQSFSAHMFEHELLMLAAAPLLVLAEPLVILLWAFPRRARRRLGSLTRTRAVAATWHRLTAPIAATVVQAIVLWLWHAPALFDIALADDGWHAVQHLCFLVGALLFWSAMLGRRGSRSQARSARGLAALCLFATSIVSGALGALMAFSQSPWYRGYAELGLSPQGLSPTEDQQLAGLIMWIPGGLVHAVAALVLARGLLAPRQSQRRVEVRDAV